ncbi:hypothetical protein NFI95_08110 [Acetobacteraceae bacterium KSS8]|uniref:Uncharacterized protein n=1 Tax=Endosaccharibacter trunci TaxID=2812733 RepID=A0ABT1W7N4_9PROT|nr:hypothetical protein [Acetobacteraceae bacterium KSS8]
MAHLDTPQPATNGSSIFERVAVLLSYVVATIAFLLAWQHDPYRPLTSSLRQDGGATTTNTTIFYPHSVLPMATFPRRYIGIYLPIRPLLASLFT